MNISVIIPVLNEEENLPILLDIITPKLSSNLDIIIVDGGSKDKTTDIIKNYKGVQLIETSLKSRAAQMNLGAQNARHDILYFIHADVLPLNSFQNDINQAIKSGFDFGCYRFKFDKNTLALRFNAYFTRFNKMFCRGGDQTLFIKKEVFTKLKGFDEYYCIMEDFDFIKRARKRFKFRIIPKTVIVSSRKYENNSYFKVNRINLISYWMFMLGKAPKKINQFYKKHLRMDYE